MPILSPRAQLALHTRCENQIENEITREPIRAGDQVASLDYKRKHSAALHRPIEATRKYNCHGLTFASRRTWISYPSEIAKILKDDDYDEIVLGRVMPGDIVLYTEEGDAQHSGIVIEVKPGPVPMILSKWGATHEVIHSVNDCPYNASGIAYYRIRT